MSDEYRGSHFKESKIDDTKRKFEGHGSIYETKGCDPSIIFKSSYFMVANNTLPKILSNPVEELSIDDAYNKSALLARIKILRFGAKYNQKHDKFPFNTGEFALLLHYMWLKLKDLPKNERKDEENGVFAEELRARETRSNEGAPTMM